MSSEPKQPKLNVQSLIVPRAEARVLLGNRSNEAIRELERQGRLTLLKFSRAKQAHGFYARSQIDALVAEMLEQAEAEAEAKAAAAAEREPEPPEPPIERLKLRRLKLDTRDRP